MTAMREKQSWTAAKKEEEERERKDNVHWQKGGKREGCFSGLQHLREDSLDVNKWEVKPLFDRYMFTWKVSIEA